jgi:epoxyqueuosine reductase
LTPDDPASVIEASFSSAGLHSFSCIGREGLLELAERSEPSAVERYGLLESSGAVVAALPYDPRGSSAEPPALCVGAFAAFNRYAALTRLLLGAGRSIAGAFGLPPKGFRAIVNSRLPEKTLAALAGIGFVGRSSLLVSYSYGPACLLGALLLPPGFPDVSTAYRSVPAIGAKGGCGTCRACADACPTGAIDRDGAGVDLERCIQHWTTRPGVVPEPVRSVWGRRLYGCDACVAACPHSARATASPGEVTSPAERSDALLLPAERRPGRFVPGPFIESASDEEIRAYFRKTALGLSWIRPEELRRNAILAGRL